MNRQHWNAELLECVAAVRIRHFVVADCDVGETE